MGLVSDMYDSGAMQVCGEIEKEIDRCIARQQRQGSGATTAQSAIEVLLEIRAFVAARYAKPPSPKLLLAALLVHFARM